jgi:hypothetical protein
MHPILKSTKASAKEPAAAKAKTSNSPSAGKGLPRKRKAAKRPSRDVNEKPAATKPQEAAAKPALLAGGNPQIAKADGDAPVQAYIAAMPGWKSDIGRRLDAKYVKVAFFRGTSLRPVPPGESKHKEVRYLDIHEGDQLDEKQLATWIKQAASIRGWDGG